MVAAVDFPYDDKGDPMRPVRLLACLGLAAVAVVPQPAGAVQTLAYTFAVNCADSVGTTTVSGLEFPNGRYAVAVVGACVTNIGSRSSMTVGTPCDLPVVGGVPCTSTTVNNLPWEACDVSTGSAGTRGCNVVTSRCVEGLDILINGICVDGQVAFHDHSGGPMTVRFSDSRYDDNAGAFLVTVVWTPL